MLSNYTLNTRLKYFKIRAWIGETAFKVLIKTTIIWSKSIITSRFIRGWATKMLPKKIGFIRNTTNRTSGVRVRRSWPPLMKLTTMLTKLGWHAASGEDIGFQSQKWGLPSLTAQWHPTSELPHWLLWEVKKRVIMIISCAIVFHFSYSKFG